MYTPLLLMRTTAARSRLSLIELFRSFLQCVSEIQYHRGEQYSLLLILQINLV